MSTDITEVQLTAYALGELFGPERAAVEAHVAADEPARLFVEDVRATGKLIAHELSNEPIVGLLAVHHAAIERRLEEPLREMKISMGPEQLAARRRRWTAFGMSIAASVMIVVGTLAVLAPSLYAPLGKHGVTVASSQPFIMIGPGDSAIESPSTEVAQNAETQDITGWTPSGGDSPNPSIAGNESIGFGPHAFFGQSAGSGHGYGRSTGGSLAPFGTEGSGRFVTRQVPRDPQRPQAHQANADAGGEGQSASNSEAYALIVENAFLKVTESPLSTFSIDVDTASYANARRFFANGQMPPADAVRTEEFINYFPYDYEGPKDDKTPFAAHIEVAGCPWNKEHRLVRVGLKGKEIQTKERPAANLVFLVDVSGSMNAQNKLPLVKQSLRMLIEKLRDDDRVALVVYAGNSGLVLPSTEAKNRQTIVDAVENMQAGGSTNGGKGIELAYATATAQFIKDGINRVILCTDGDFNVGVTNEGDLTRLIEDKAKSGVFLSVLGFGMGNLKDSTMEKLADKGNGNYGYIDTQLEAYKLLVEQMNGTLVTIAKDVKIQVEFNPVVVGEYRLIGYENRMLAKEDFNNDKKDAGEIGAGHSVTALYEVVPAGKEVAGAAAVDALKYQRPMMIPVGSDEMLTLKLRYKQPAEDVSKLVEFSVKDAGTTYAQATGDFKFAASVAEFAMLLRDSQFKGTGSFDAVLELGAEGKGADKAGYRGEFLELVRKAKELKKA